MTESAVHTPTREITDAEKRDAEYVKTLMATVGIATSLVVFCVVVAARLLLN